ncbi:molecular chaperone [Pseudomonas sp. BBP2017]|uniref:fimbrial biogenesis chaperone n=1 Tax=Pseudomonas sp. BBP2017 TaxID=2109731 RepID=UPI000D124748|nr:molecular chaperone [Pseudomonas sp. BBP2017]PSS48248.1 pilus assembly protein [Pseudomonas sp. BBP2017]
MLLRSLPACLGLLGMLSAAPATASISLSATRIVFDGAHKEANITVRNGNQDVLIQSWVDNNNDNTASIPFAVTPPLARILAKEQQLLRILYEGVGMPTDKESVLWLNVQEIPQSSTKANTLQLAVRQRIKIFFRPANLPGDALLAPAHLQWSLSQQAGKTTLVVKNPSFYHVSMADVTLQNGSHREVAIESTMVAPGEVKTFALRSVTALKPLQLTFNSINDYGAQNQYRATLSLTDTRSARIVDSASTP